MKRIPLCAAVLLLFSLLACKNKPAASSDKRPASASDTLSDDALMDTVQRRTFQYFWEGGEPYSGMARERYHIDNVYPAGGPEVVTSGGSGFGIMAILSGIDRGYVSRQEGLERMDKIVTFLEKADRFHGAYPHWWNGETGKVLPFGSKDNGGDLVETAFLMQGLLAVHQYYVNGTSATVIYMERPLRKAEYTIHIEVPPNPFWASVGLSIEPLPIGSGVQYESRVSLGYLNQSFQNAVMEGVLYGCEQGLYGWKVTDCKICFEYGLYYSPVSTPADFRLLSPIVLEQALKKAGTELLEPYLHFEIYAPQEYLSRAYHDAPRYCADIVSTQIKNDEVILKGEIPARCIQEYRNDLTYFTNGQGVCLTELKGYQPAIGKFICQPRRPNSRIDKVRHMFHKLA